MSRSRLLMLWGSFSRVATQRNSFSCAQTPCALNISPQRHLSVVHNEGLLPEYKPRVGEKVEVKRARLLYQSRKRGILENGLLLSSFAAKYLSGFSPNQLDQYDHLINTPSNDWQLYYWFTGREDPPADYDNEVMDLIKEHTKSGNLFDS